MEQATPVARTALTPRTEAVQPCVLALAGAWPPAGDALVDPLVPEPEDPQPTTASAAIISATAKPRWPAEA